jgi:HD-GYP domain-containing protein (c-di-GMP phosphodiesterase class II)
MDAESFRNEVMRLNQIGIALSSVHDLDQLLEMIVREARAFTGADGGSLYLREGDHLHFVISQNDTLRKRLGEEGERALFSAFQIPISTASIAGYAAVTKKNLNLEDVYALPADAPFHFNPDFDKRNDYRTRSMLTVPMLDHLGEVRGVLQLVNATQDGRVDRFDPEEEDLVRSLASQAAVAVNNARLTAEIKKMHLDTIYRLSVAAEYKDHDTAAHIRRMSLYSEALARRLGWSAHQTELLLYASPMHDVGKIGIPDSILLKPGKLTDEEFAAVKRHPVLGADALEAVYKQYPNPLVKTGMELARSHHERWDGSGYPAALAGEAIPLSGRITMLADQYDALRTARPYKPVLDAATTCAIITKGDGRTLPHHFDPRILAAFGTLKEEFDRIHDEFQG